MLDRRSLFAAAAATTVVGSTLGTRKAQARPAEYDLEPRGTIGRLERMPNLDLESVHDFTSGFRTWHGRFSPIADARVKEIFEQNGIDPKADLSMKEVLALIENDPIVFSSR